MSNYDEGVTKLEYKSGYEEDWFCKYTDSWKEYLRNGVTVTPDVKYVGKNTGNSITVHKQFEVNGTEYFVSSYDDDPFSARMHSKEDFEANYKVVPLKPKYNDGQLYVGRHGSDKKEYVYMYRAANESFITLNDGRWARVDWHEEQNGGPLKAADIYTDRGKAIVAKVQK